VKERDGKKKIHKKKRKKKVTENEPSHGGWSVGTRKEI
jgi:hypothetical protein